MNIYDITTHKKLDKISDNPEAQLVIVCRADKVPQLVSHFGWDESIAQQAAILDENVRYDSYEGYDFISLIHASNLGGEIIQREVNVVISRHYLVLVLPENAGERLERLAKKLLDAVESPAACSLMLLYHSIFHNLTVDFSETLEALEDDMEAMTEAIMTASDPRQLTQIGQLRKAAYTLKKILRALTHIGGQILMDENRLRKKAHQRYFRNVDTRLMKLYDFADNLYELSTELLHTYDSKSNARLNESMNKLTMITLFFGPLTVITGIYGMNFDFMPELHWTLGYPYVIVLMAVVTFIVYLVLKKKRWM
ncbi:MAG: magnesium transporter CorA family protein [Clostridiales bacterium]|nr:magnesium transporter CorA family protein [Clostridiales bacterium]